MSSRAVSDDPKKVVAYAREFLRGLGDAAVLGCGKHFPGLGEATLDTHRELPRVEKSLRKLWDEDLVPYRLLRRELPMVMVSHAAYPKVTPAVTKDRGNVRTPASLSKKWITDILRKKIGYRGLICSDDLEMGGVLAAAPIEQAIIEMERDARFARRVQESARRVLAFKRKLLATRRISAPTSARVEKLTRQLWEFGEEIRMATLARTGNKKERA